MIHLHLLCFLTVIFPALGLPTTPDVVADPRPGRDASDLRVRSPSDATTSTKPMTIIRRNEGQDDKLRQFRRVDPYEEYDLRTRQRSLKGHKARLAKERGEEVSIADEREKVVKESVKKMDLSWREVLDEGRVHELSNKQHATYSDCMGSFSKSKGGSPALHQACVKLAKGLVRSKDQIPGEVKNQEKIRTDLCIEAMGKKSAAVRRACKKYGLGEHSNMNEVARDVKFIQAAANERRTPRRKPMTTGTEEEAVGGPGEEVTEGGRSNSFLARVDRFARDTVHNFKQTAAQIRLPKDLPAPPWFRWGFTGPRVRQARLPIRI